MKILPYSDLHLEFGASFQPPPDDIADVMVLAGDIMTFKDYAPLDAFLEKWKKPVLYVMGNHEHYTSIPMDLERQSFLSWIEEYHPNVRLLENESVSIGGVHFFGGTMWTDFSKADESAMEFAYRRINDYRCIVTDKGEYLTPEHAVEMHKVFRASLLNWLTQDLSGPRVIVTHHAPVPSLDVHRRQDPLGPAFHSLDMEEIIETFQPDLWIYGHTHECEERTVGKTRLIANAQGYPLRDGGYECGKFDPLLVWEI